MSFGFSAGDIIAIVQKIQDVHDTLAASYERDDSKRVAMTLESSKQKLELWLNTWLGDASNALARSETLWGKTGWVDVQRLLAEIKTTIQQFHNIDDHDISNVNPRPWWKRAISSHAKRPRSISVKPPSVSDMALELEKCIDELWTYSEITFDSLHGLLSHDSVQPAKNSLLDQSITIRRGAVALYDACQMSKVECNLDVDLLGTVRHDEDNPTPVKRPRSQSLTPDSNLFYHLFIDSADPKTKLGDVTIESYIRPEKSMEFSSMKTHDKPNLELFKHHSLGKKSPFRIRHNLTDVGPAFRVQSSFVSWSLSSDSENLAQILYKGRASLNTKKPQILSLSAKLDLAYKLAECGFFLLGTPWLGSLSSKTLRLIKDANGSETFAISIQTSRLEDLYLSDPDALSETSQLFRIGVLLMELALGNPDHSDRADVEEPYLRASKMLPRVQMAAGTQYCKACAFCIQDRRCFSMGSFARHEKYLHEEETGWDVYLRDLLEEYDAQVLSRLRDILQIAGSS